MSDAPVVRKAFPQAQSTASGHTQMTSRQPHISEPTASKRVYFYKSGDAQFSGLPVVINSRTFKTFEALLDSLSKRVPLPFGVRTITTPRGHTAVRSLDQIHHGHSYICSDRRTVKPIDLEQARRKLPPWYHARPVSARGLAWYRHKPTQHGTRNARRNEHAILLHTPKRLVLFRNGEPEVKQTLMLQRRTTYSFEALLDHMSEVMRFPVLKLHTPEGRRVDGIPALILCSGVLVAAGREPFKKRNYIVQKSPPPTWLHGKRFGRRRPINRKKKSNGVKSYPFSLSSEHYFVNQIQNSMPGSRCDFPSNPNGSVDVQPGQHLESVAETEIFGSLDGEREIGTYMPSDDDIEKSFRVNQDGSMTVEMKVRLTIKEEETIHWTTTVSRSNVYNQLKANADSCSDMDANLHDKLPPQNDTLAIEASGSSTDDSGPSSEEGCKVNEQNGGPANLNLEQLPSPLPELPGLHREQHQQGSIVSMKTIRDTEVHKNLSYTFMEDLNNGEVKHESYPVPKPRSTLPSEMTTSTCIQSSSYRSSEIFQFQDNQTCETVLQVYEQQTCQDSFRSNLQPHLQGFSGSPFGSPQGIIGSSDTLFPASSDKTFNSSNEDLTSEIKATIKCQSSDKQDTLLPISKPHTSGYKSRTTSIHRAKVSLRPVSASSKAYISRGVHTLCTTTKRKPVRVIVKKNYLFKFPNPERKQRDSKADILKEIKKIRADILTQKGSKKQKEPVRGKTIQKLLKRINNSENVPRQSKTPPSECVQLKTNDSSLLLVENEQNTIQAQSEKSSLTKKNLQNASLITGMLTQQTSEYVELWLQKSSPQPVPMDSSLETIPKHNTLAKALLFNYQATKTTHPSTNESFDEKGIHTHSPKPKMPGILDKEQVNSDHLTKARENQQTFKLISKASSNNTDNTLRRPLEVQTKSPTELTDLPDEKFFSVKMAVRPDMKPVLDQLCNSIRSLREITQHKRLSSLKTSKCVPDFSSHLSSTFSSSSQVFLAFLSVMVLKDGLGNLNITSHTETNLSCSEAMLMLQSLKELAAIEDPDHLSKGLSDLHSSASDQLLLRWKDFQVLSDKARSSDRSDSARSECHYRPNSNEEEHNIELLMERLGLPERVREELAAFKHVDEYMKCNQMEDTHKVSQSKTQLNGLSELHLKEETDSGLEDYVKVYVSSIIDGALDAHCKDSVNSQALPADCPETDNILLADRDQSNLRNENFYHRNRHFQDDLIPDSNGCEDMPFSESRLAAEMYRELLAERAEVLEMENVRNRGPEKETVTDHQEMEKDTRTKRQIEMDEGIGTWEDSISEVENSLKTLLNEEDVIEKVLNEMDRGEGTKPFQSLYTYAGKLHFPMEDDVSQLAENGNYHEEIFAEGGSFNNEENLSMKSTGPKDDTEQIENEFQIIQTGEQLHNNTVHTEENVVLSEEQDISRFLHIQSNAEVDRMQLSKSHQSICMESRTYSEEENVILEAPECYTIYQENFEEIAEEATEYEESEADFREERTVAELISSLQDQERSAGNKHYNTIERNRLNHHNGTNLEESNAPRPTKSASMDSLAFSYDSKNSPLVSDSEGHIQTNRVKSIRDMFLAKTNTDIQHGQTQLGGPDLSEYQHESSDVKGYSSSSSSSSTEVSKDTCRLTIAKGYVKRTIEQLYGKASKGSSHDDKKSSSTHKLKKKDVLKSANAPSLPSIHEAHAKVIPELTYFNPTSSVDAFNEPTHCVTLNASVGPKDAVLIDKGRWLLKESQMSVKPSSDNEKVPKDIKAVLVESEQETGKEDVPYSLFGHCPLNPHKGSSITTQGDTAGKTITYFHLPNANDSEVQGEEPKTDTPKRKKENKVTPLTEPSKCSTDKQSIATVFTSQDIKRAANKVHPMMETTESPVVTQPMKGQSSGLVRRSAEPDALEILYVFCGQHCPIL